MAALTKERNTPMRNGVGRSLAVKAATTIYAGALVAIDTADGYAIPAKTSTTLKAMGRAQTTVDNASGSAGDVWVAVRTGVFLYKNMADGNADEITPAQIGSDCYIVDDQTVAKTNGSSSRSVAGKVFDLDIPNSNGTYFAGVWVEVG